MLDVAVLLNFLTPALPFLLKVGDKALDGALSKMGEDGWERAKKLWEPLGPKVEKDPGVKKAAEKVAANPDDVDRQTALRVALKDLLEEDADLMEVLRKILEEDLPEGDDSKESVNQQIGSMSGNSKAVASIKNVSGNVTL